MENLALYERVRSVPEQAQKKIGGGRLKGMTDIQPMWRIKTLTEQFGPCGFGWRYEIVRQWIEQGTNGEISAFCNINLYVKIEEKWSEAIPGTGGSSFVAKEKNGTYTSDECYKMALTDALSVSCKALGMAADVYWDGDRTKYSRMVDDLRPASEILVDTNHIAVMATELARTGKDVTYLLQRINEKFGASLTKVEQVTINQFKWIMPLMKAAPSAQEQNA